LGMGLTIAKRVCYSDERTASPKEIAMAKKIRVGVILDPGVHEKVKVLAEQEDVSVSYIIRRCLVAYVKSQGEATGVES